MKKIKDCEQDISQVKQSKYESSYVFLAGHRILFIKEDITKKLATELSALLLYYDNCSSEEDIHLYIHTNGGDVAALSQIYDVMQLIQAPIQTVCLGKAYSAGAALLAAGSKGKRFAFKNSKVMIHGAQCVFPIAGQDQINSKKYLEFMQRNNNIVMRILSDHTGHTIEKVSEDCKRDLYLNSKQALEYGIIDEVIG